MAIFGKQLPAGGAGDPAGRITALEEHIRYMQEMLEYNARQTEKALREMRAEMERLKDPVAGGTSKGGNEHGQEKAV